jgi:hypothetical protein
MEIKDVLGIQPVAEAAKRLTEATVDGAAAFLGRICLPAAEEFGLLLRDRVHAWRAANLARIAAKAEHKLSVTNPGTAKHAHPRLVASIVEQGSWTESDEVQELWAGLLASSCTDDGKDDSGIMFIDILGRLTVSQVQVFNHACTKTKVELSAGGWLIGSGPIVDLATLKEITALEDLHRMDRELDHLRTVGLLNEGSGGFRAMSTEADLTPSAIGLQMFARCNGYRDPIEFYRKKGMISNGAA